MRHIVAKNVSENRRDFSYKLVQRHDNVHTVYEHYKGNSTEIGELHVGKDGAKLTLDILNGKLSEYSEISIRLNDDIHFVPMDSVLRRASKDNENTLVTFYRNVKPIPKEITITPYMWTELTIREIPTDTIAVIEEVCETNGGVGSTRLPRRHIAPLASMPVNGAVLLPGNRVLRLCDYTENLNSEYRYGNCNINIFSEDRNYGDITVYADDRHSRSGMYKFYADVQYTYSNLDRLFEDEGLHVGTLTGLNINERLAANLWLDVLKKPSLDVIYRHAGGKHQNDWGTRRLFVEGDEVERFELIRFMDADTEDTRDYGTYTIVENKPSWLSRYIRCLKPKTTHTVTCVA